MILPSCCSLVGFTMRASAPLPRIRSRSLTRFKVERTNQALHGRFGKPQLGTPLVIATMFNPPFECNQDAAGVCAWSAPVTVLTWRAIRSPPTMSLLVLYLPSNSQSPLVSSLVSLLFHISAINLGSTVSISVWPCSLPVRLFLLTIRSL